MVVSSSAKKRITDWTVRVILSLGVMMTILPFIIMILTALTKDAYQISFPYKFIPDPWYFQNLLDVWRLVPFFRGIINSSIVSVTVTVVGMLVSALAAFSFAKLKFPGRDKLFIMLLATMMIPYAVVLIPQYIGYGKLKWVDTLLPIIVPGLFGNAAVIFFLRQYFQGIPDDLISAAKIDGASYPMIFRIVILPLGIPAIAAQGILSFMGCWNDFFGPMIYLNTPERQTLPVLLTNFQGLYNSNFSLIMAGAFQAMLPLIIVFAFAQRYIIESIVITGLKA
ncbi:MAG TPA: carbohydrate ABC transporter permease [Clostridiaceae bacterium]|nr:carbohydrate ABC transporter permease [Clostridiaceae bacterium]